MILIFIFPVYSLLTSLWSLYPLLSIYRSLYLILLYAGIYSIVTLNNQIFSDKGLRFLMPANIFVISLSLFSLLTGIPENNWTGGHGLGFMGFAVHQNTLASALLFTMPGLLYLEIRNKNSMDEIRDSLNSTSLKGIKSDVIIFLLLTLNLILLFLTYSRASILALVAGILTYFIVTKSKKVLILLLSFTVLIIVFYMNSSAVQSSVNSILSKDGGNILDRRMILWEPSWQAAKQGGLFGLGYGVSSPDIKTPVTTGSHYENGRYIREKGNSTLALIEETGLIGLVLFLLPAISMIRKFKFQISPIGMASQKFKIGQDHSSFLILYSSLLAMLIHSQFEAWWVGPGSVQFPIYLFVMMIILDLDI
jgi:hypothetical protein